MKAPPATFSDTDDRDHWMRTAHEREGRLNECRANVAKLENEIAKLRKPLAREKTYLITASEPWR